MINGYAAGAGVVPTGVSFKNGGPVEDDEEEDIEGQGADDATLDPMSLIQGALDYGMRQLGVRAGDSRQDDEMQPAMQGGGVVPEAEDAVAGVTGPGNPDAINPRAMLEYLSGAGAVSPEIAQAFEQRIDPQGQMDPTERIMQAVTVAPTDEARFGLLQHYRTKYNIHSAAAKAAMQQGDMGEAARQATVAMNNVPDGKSTQFAPGPNGLMMFQKPARGQPQGETTLSDRLYRAVSPGLGARRERPGVHGYQEGGLVEEEEEPVSPEVTTAYEPDPVVPNAPQQEVPTPVPMTDEESKAVPTPALNLPTTTTEATVQQYLPQELIKALDEGFDAKLSQPSSQPHPMPKSFSEIIGQAPDNIRQLMRMAGNKLAERGKVIAGGAQEKLDALGAAPNQPLPPTGYPEEVIRPPEGAAAKPVTAPATRPAAPAARSPAGAVVDQNRVNPFTGQVRAPAPGAYGSQQEALTGQLPRIAYGNAPGVVPTSPQASPAGQRAAPFRDRGPWPAGRDFYVPTGEQIDNYRYGRGKVTIHPSGYDETGAPAYMTRRISPMFSEQLGHPGFYGEGGAGARRPPSTLPVYGTTGVSTAGQAARARADYPDMAYDRRSPVVPEMRYDIGTRNPLYGGRDVDKEGPVWERGLTPEARRYSNEAKSLMPRTSQEGARTAYTASRAATERAEQLKRDLELERTNRAEAGATNRAQMAIRADVEKDKRADKLARANLLRDERRAEQKMQQLQFTALYKSRIQADTNAMRQITELYRADPKLAQDPFRVEQLISPALSRAGMTQQYIRQAARELTQVDPATGQNNLDSLLRGASSGAAGGGERTATDAAVDHKVKPGDKIPFVGPNGKTYYYVIGPDGVPRLQK